MLLPVAAMFFMGQLGLIELYNTKKASSINLHELSYFHSNFEKTHPFQDGNGRIGRFLLFKQCLENNIDLIAVNEKYNKEYRTALYESQLNQNYNNLIEILKKCKNSLKSQ